MLCNLSKGCYQVMKKIMGSMFIYDSHCMQPDTTNSQLISWRICCQMLTYLNSKRALLSHPDYMDLSDLFSQLQLLVAYWMLVIKAKVFRWWLFLVHAVNEYYHLVYLTVHRSNLKLINVFPANMQPYHITTSTVLQWKLAGTLLLIWAC